jgi:prevent-host-death family protein
VHGRPDQIWSIIKVMVVRNISQAKAELSALIEAVVNGDEVIIAKAGKPIARLVAFRGLATPRTPGSMAGEIWIAPDFDTLPDDVAESFGMREPRS